jgi:hypothetical protein
MSTESPAGWTYKVLAMPRDLAVMKKLFQKNDPAALVADYVEKTISDAAAAGWEFYRIDSVSLTETPGCLGAIFGQKETYQNFNVLIFRRPRT